LDTPTLYDMFISMNHTEKYCLVKLATTSNPRKDDSITKNYVKYNLTPSQNADGTMIQDPVTEKTKFDHYDAAAKGTIDPTAWVSTPDLFKQTEKERQRASIERTSRHLDWWNKIKILMPLNKR